MATAQSVPHASSDVSVMISYSRTDAVFARQLRDDLKDAGFPTWLDTSNIPGGRQWRREIDQAIDEAQVTLVVLSPASMQSKWVRREYTRALRRGKVVIPLDYYPCNIPASLARLQLLSFRPSFVNTEAFYAQQFQELTTTLAGYASLDASAQVIRPLSRRYGLTTAMALIVLLGLVLASLSGYADGALLPEAAQPHASVGFLGGVALLVLGLVALVIQRMRQPGEVNLYLDDRNRFLSKVQTRYTNRLKPPFAGAVLLTLGLSEEAQAVARPSLARQEGPAGTPHPLPAATTIATAFNDAEGQLLILGAPGAGKSWLLFQLALDLVERAHSDVTIPVPVALNLASWAIKRLPLADWMVGQLHETWQVPPAIARVWVDRHQVFPLLDGLDEVTREARDACVEAINRYQRDQGLFPLAVCCRKADYDALEARLDLRTAVVAEPLTPQQIDRYLGAGGAPLAALQILAREDMQLRELLSTPLLLNIVALAYAGKEAGAIPRPTSDKMAWTRAVFHEYVPTTLARRPTSQQTGRKQRERYSVAETTRYLAWLAAQMQAHDRTDMFYLEQVQPDWLPDAQTQRGWRFTTQTVYFLVFGLVTALGFGQVLGVLYGMLVGVGFGFVAAWTLAGRKDKAISFVASARLLPEWRSVRAGLVSTLESSVVLAFLFGLVFWLSAGRTVFNLVFGLAFGFIIGTVYGLVADSMAVTSVNPLELSDANAGPLLSLRSGLRVALVAGLISGLMNGLPQFADGMIHMASGFAIGFMGGACFGVWFGLDDYLRHRLLLRELAHRRLIPRHYITFLSFAADHVLLQRVGGGYRFVHALLLDYFADQWPDLSKSETRKQA